ncbi:tetratricopeptide repeat protein [Amphritea balenae]|uniref:Sel1 repeat family protein n=1 Tax=Amphritea balenae TaxID=452629 RepID=A0A3P1SVS1_9GAMM|nr:tetratricopeptide repeat protein [Amphritea balenae]RRD01271.1 sel1 repeat family protein [Amphritea balenae]GGK58562.1 hypothetical protein GCM10007941_05920 [Amphritea balenae]
MIRDKFRAVKLAILMLTVVLSGCSGFSGFGYQEGPRVHEDRQQARMIYQQGMDATQGRGQAQDYQLGVQLFKESAKYGSVDGAYMVGMSYVTGRGVATDYNEAADWLDLAARKDHPAALYQLSVLYLNGKGVPKNSVWAAFLLNRAGDLGHRQSSYDLGVAYAKGLGVKPQPGAAWYWFSVARKKGISEAIPLQTRMLRRSSDEQRRLAMNQMRYRGAKVDRPTAQFIQQRLNTIGYKAGIEDGIWGARTEQAFLRFTRQELLLNELELDWRALKMIRDY